jgi:hypothetical protein
VLEPLGQGGMRDVYATQHTELDRKVGLKLLGVETFTGRPGVELVVRDTGDD